MANENRDLELEQAAQKAVDTSMLALEEIRGLVADAATFRGGPNARPKQSRAHIREAEVNLAHIDRKLRNRVRPALKQTIKLLDCLTEMTEL